MTRFITLTESEPRILDLNAPEATALATAGTRLASKKQWWRDDEVAVGRTVIPMTRCGPGQLRVRLIDAVGLISVSDLQIEIVPKIPIDNFLYLLNMSGWFPRIDEQRVTPAHGATLWD